MKAEKWAREREEENKKSVYVWWWIYQGNETSDFKGLFQIVLSNLEKQEHQQIFFAKIKAIGSLPLCGTFLFRIPRHHENAQELKSLILRTFRTFLLFYRCTTQGVKKTNYFLQVTQEGLETEARTELHPLVTSPVPNKKNNFLALC